MLIDAPFLRPNFIGTRLRPLRSVLAAAALVALSGTAFADPEFVKSVKPAAGLYELVFSQPLNRVYVAAAGARGAKETSVVALDPATLEVKETIALGDDPVFGLGINNATKTLYGTQTRDGKVAAIDLTTGKIVATIAKGEKAHVRQVVVDEAANKIYVSVVGMRDTPSEIWIIDGATNKLDRAIEGLPAGITGLALDAKGKRLFASTMTSNVHVVDLAAEKVVKSFPSGSEGAINLIYEPTGNQLFIAHQGAGDVTVLDATSGDLVKKIPTGEGALSLALDPGRGIVYVANRRAGFVTLIDTKTLEPIANIVTGSMPQTVAVDAATGNAYVTNKMKSAGRPRPPAPPAGAAAPAGTPPAAPVAAAPAGTPPAAPVAAAPAGAPPAGGAEGGARPKPVPMIDPYGDTVTLIKP